MISYVRAIDVEIGQADPDRTGEVRMNFLNPDFENFFALQRFGAKDESVGKGIGGA